MFSKIQPNTFSSPIFIFSENKNRKQPNQTPWYIEWQCEGMKYALQYKELETKVFGYEGSANAGHRIRK